MKPNDTGSPIRINSTNIDLGDVLPRKIQEDLLHAAETYFGYLNHATVGFTRDGNWYCCTINLQVGNLKVFVAEASATDCRKAFDLALERSRSSYAEGSAGSSTATGARCRLRLSPKTIAGPEHASGPALC